MKPPNVTPPPSEQLQTTSQQLQLPPSTTTTTLAATSITKANNDSAIIDYKTNNPKDVPATVGRSQTENATQQVQQAPLELTTQIPALTKQTQLQHASQQLQPQFPPSITTTLTNSIPLTNVSVDNSAATPITTSQSQPIQIAQMPPRLQPATTLQTTITVTPPTINSSNVQPITLAATPTSSGPTALVIIPQHSTSPLSSSKTATISAKTTQIPTTLGNAVAHVTLATTTQPGSIQIQAPITTSVTNIAPIPLTAHQQSTITVQPPPTLVSRPPSTLPIVPIATTPSNIKSEPNKYVCCLLDNGIRCDRIAGNASFNARIQKIVGTKKMNFALDPTVRHAYICEHHKAIITVAKKSTALTRDNKSNARNYTANINANNTLAAQHNNNFNDLSVKQGTNAHPVNLELLANQNRLANNHAGVLNSMSVRAPGSQIAYGHYLGSHQNQAAPMDVMMSGNFDSAGGDSGAIPSSSSGIDVDLQQLQVNTLRRYKRHFRVQTRPGLNKMQLAESLKGHFRTLPIIEKEAITYFVYIVKCYRNKLDHNPKAD